MVIQVVRGGSKISGKGFYMYKGVGVRFAVIYIVFLKYPIKMK